MHGRCCMLNPSEGMMMKSLYFSWCADSQKSSAGEELVFSTQDRLMQQERGRNRLVESCVAFGLWCLVTWITIPQTEAVSSIQST